MLTIQETAKIIGENSLSGFSVAVKWELKRYVVANTHNKFDKMVDELHIADILTEQANENMCAFDNVTIWGWEDIATKLIYIDTGMSTDDLEYAIKTGKHTNQIAIWDNLEQKEIRL